MVLDGLRPMKEEAAPRMLRQPADPPPPLPRLGEERPVQAFRDEWRAQQAQARLPLRGRARRWLGRVSGRSDRRLLLAVATATDALAAHCDLFADRLSKQEAIAHDVAASYGEDLTRLRAEVEHLRALVISLGDTRG
jgi:hypothetical protein